MIFRNMMARILLTLGIKPTMPIQKLLWPQYEQDRGSYNKEISQAHFDELQDVAKHFLKTQIAGDKITNHWKSIAEGKVPFGLTVKTKGRKHGKD